jgi:hypothetical protein
VARRSVQGALSQVHSKKNARAFFYVSSEAQSTSNAATPLIRTLDTSHPDKYRKREKESKEASDK